MKLNSVNGGKSNAKGLLSSLAHIRGNRQMNLDANSATKMWDSLNDAIHLIFKQNSSSLSFEILYGYSYKLCLHKKGDMLYNGVSGTIREHLMDTLATVVDVPNEGLLTGLRQIWDEFKSTVVNIKDVLMYMDRTWVKQQQKLPTYEMALSIFRDVVIYSENIRPRLKEILLENVYNERRGQLIDKDIMRSVLCMLVELGMEGIMPYEDEFETDFLHHTKDFYSQESRDFLSQCTCSDYINKAQTHIMEEHARSTTYLSPSSYAKLMSVVDAELITAHAKTLVEMDNSGCAVMFSSRCVADLKSMYELFKRVPATLDTLRDFMGQYVRKAGSEIVSDQESMRNPVLFVQRILDLKARFDDFTHESFSSEKKVQRKLKEAFEAFVNQDQRCASHLAAYIDDLLKNSLKGVSEAEAEAHLDQFVVIFRFLTDKDVFENFYKNLLSKRLLGGKSLSDELEKMMIAKLKAECGYQFTSKLEGMFTDMQLSKDTMEEFKQSDHYKQLPRMELDVQMLTTGYWPLKTLPSCLLPTTINECCHLFSSFYLQKYQGRKIVWVTQHGSADVRAVYKQGVRNLMLSTYQMCIIMMFNENKSMSLDQIMTAVGASDDLELKRHLLSLCTPKNRILVKKSKVKGILPDDEFMLNEDFTSRLKRIKVPLISMKEIVGPDGSPQKAAGGREELPPTVEEDRRHLIEASIVRIMKTRKTLLHNDLVAEVTRQLQMRFMPRPASIKKRIESLIERDYLERDKEDNRLYIYQA